MAVMTAGTWPQSKKERITAPVGSDLRQLEIQFNLLLTNLATLFNALTGECVLNEWTMAIGSTDTRIGTGALQATINGVPFTKAADATGTAFGALGTIPASKWGLIAVDVVAAGTVSFVSAAANYTTGYATEAAAIAANPAVTADKVRAGYVTILASSSTFVVGTDALAGGASGNPATTTNYYTTDSVYDDAAWTASQIATLSGTVLTSSNY